MDYKILEHKLLFNNNDLTNNNTSVLVIEKNLQYQANQNNDIDWVCPITKKPLERMENCFYCPESFLLYPIIKSIPCLLPKNAIIASHFKNFE